jgi:hypothetical protein
MLIYNHPGIPTQKSLIAPNSPSDGVQVAFIKDNGAPVELMQIEPK